MSEELDVLILVAGRLDAARIPYMLSGSTAMNVYAQPRMTAKPSHSGVQLRDVRNVIDCVSDLDWSDLERWAADLNVTPTLRVRLFQRTYGSDFDPPTTAPIIARLRERSS